MKEKINYSLIIIMRMTAHTTPRMIIIYKKKVMRKKKKRKSGFHMKDINPSGFLLLLSGSFLELPNVKAPNSVSILGTTDHQQWT